MVELSIVRQNLLTRPGYTPYCGSHTCKLHWPRTHWSFQHQQFECYCGYRTSFEKEFIDQLQEKWGGFK